MTSAHRWNEFIDERIAGLECQRILLNDDPVDAQVEVVVYRDPDGRGADGVDVRVFVEGNPVGVRLFVVDPGAGYSLAEWNNDRAIAVQEASPAAAEVIGELYDTGADTEFTYHDTHHTDADDADVRNDHGPTGAADA